MGTYNLCFFPCVNCMPCNRVHPTMILSYGHIGPKCPFWKSHEGWVTFTNLAAHGSLKRLRSLLGLDWDFGSLVLRLVAASPILHW